MSMKVAVWICLLFGSMMINVYCYHQYDQYLDTTEEQVNTDDGGSDLLGRMLEDALQDMSDGGTNAIARYLGFLCPAGHRCLPVLECLPCDYGTFKSNVGSDLCDQCPAGCTTLRKGATSWQECVPKCPPGYEESECGKTCSKCRPGYYKSSWKNTLCSKCPRRANFDKNIVGMTKRRQCFAEEYITTEAPEEVTVVETEAPVVVTEPTVGADQCNDQLGACDAYQYEIVRLVPINDCTQFCQCEHGAGYTEENPVYEWALHNCAAGTLFDSTIGVCNHDYLVECDAGTGQDITTNTPNEVTVVETEAPVVVTEPTVGVGLCNDQLGACDAYQYEIIRLVPINDCIQFCQCEHGAGYTEENPVYEWALHNCAAGTLFDSEIGVCNHETLVECDAGTGQDITTNAPNEVTVVETEAPVVVTESTIGVGLCNDQLGACNAYQYEIIRLVPINDCTQFCQCEHGAGYTEENPVYEWALHNCAAGTLFDSEIGVCNHETLVECDAGNATVFETQAPVVETEAPVVTEPPSPTTGGDPCTEQLGTCDAVEYAITRLVMAPVSNCTQFCQCEHGAGYTEENPVYEWALHNCAAGTLFDSEKGVCNHYDLVECDADYCHVGEWQCDNLECIPFDQRCDSVPDCSDGTDEAFCGVTGLGCEDLGACNATSYDIVRLVAKPNSGCSEFCQCAFEDSDNAGVISYYWVQHSCPVGTLFNEDIKACDHIDTVTCDDVTLS